MNLLRTGEKFKVEHAQVEKDYWITKVLKEIAESDFSGKVFFKGGTSLSKAYGLIDRFSEDLDLYVDTGRPTAGGDPEKKLNSDEFLMGMALTNNQDWLQHKNPHTQLPYSDARIFFRLSNRLSERFPE